MKHLVLLAFLLAACGDGFLGLGQSRGGVTSCPQSPAPKLFARGLCLCGDYDLVGRGFSARSSSGPADVGINGRTHVVGLHQVQGSMVAYGGIDGIGKVDVTESLSTAGSARGLGMLKVGKDLSVGQDVASVGYVEVGGTLRVGGSTTSIGYEKVASRAAYVAPPGPPCDCASPLDVRKAIEQARTQNNNGQVGLGTSDVIGVRDVTLPTGRYYFDDVRTIGKSRITVEGTVAIFIDGSLDSIGDDNIRLGPGSTLDLYVSERVANIGFSRMGSVADPSALRLYIGGPGGYMLQIGARRLFGSIYAPTADLHLVGDTHFHGAVFARDLKGVGNLELEAASPQAPPAGACPPGGGSGGGQPPVN